MQGFHELITERDFAQARDFLAGAGLSLPCGVDFGLAVFEDGRMIATGFLAGKILCGLAVLPCRQGQDLSAAMTGRLMERGRAGGMTHFLLFTKASEADKFQALGFAEIARTDRAALLEFGRPAYADWLARTRQSLETSRLEAPSGAKAAASGSAGFPLAAVVMNANPFTLGHRCLVRAALALAGRVAVFVVEEEASVFPFAVRFSLVRRGIADLDGAVALAGGDYLVSRASFPAYFTGEAEQAGAHAGLDATIFARRVAPDLGVTLRCVGAEPHCAVTAGYNEALLAILPASGVACREVPRLEKDGRVVSASRVREFLAETPPDWKAVEGLVPAATWEYLQSPEALPILEALREQRNRH